MLEEQASIRSNPDPPKNNKFARFLLKSWQPIPTWQSTICLFTIIGVILLAFGIALVFINASIVEVSVSYRDACRGQASCTFTFTVEKEMSAPVFFYYGLDNFYQNHRRYINSKSARQLAGHDEPLATLESDCSPVVTNSQMGQTTSKTGATLDPAAAAIPCGLIARTMFDDVFAGMTNTVTSDTYTILSDGIAWPSDKNNKFKNVDLSKQWYDMTDEHFIVWMRTAGLPDFRKLWGRIEKNVPAGQYTITITNNYNVDEFEGDKKIILSTTGPFGGKNAFLAYSYIAVGGACLLISVFFLVRWRHYSKKNM